ncbi:MAG TPA: selenide, water dikinase SelD [Candidatus Sulfotelmatobacter sp.]|nr:selenide, water dikinase SelD [Candidatus Sulfotelmatobacter sp.]
MKVDLAKRRRVMERSMRLGHCICDPKRPCPCDVFRNQQICPCAGERPEPVDVSQVKLTQLVHNAGCASKISPADLEGVLRRLPEVKDSAVISGLAAADDAAIYRIADNLCLVQTVDVFTPCVDDPYLFGRICAANCLSDIYAMGGEPRTALSILAFPSETLNGEIMYQMLAGAMETLGQAEVALVGGHSIKDEEIKLGFAITGVIDPAVARALEQPRTGDVLVLTKPLGTGVLAFCAQVGRGNTSGLAAAAQSMATLNKAAAEAMKAAGASACTDITGFGLFGHLLRMARQSQVTVQVFAEALPAFEGVLEAFREGVIPGAVERNREFVNDHLEIAPEVEEAWVHLGCDAQTSGGLLIAIAPERVERLQRALGERGIKGIVIGQCVGASEGRILLTRAGQNDDKPTEDKTMTSDVPEAQLNTQQEAAFTGKQGCSPPQGGGEAHPAGCCADVFDGKSAASTAGESHRAFGAMMRATLSAGALDAKTKELILFSLILHSRCAPCFEAHYEKALELGITQAELDEAAWCAITMGGAPVRMFYQESLQKAQQSKRV